MIPIWFIVIMTLAFSWLFVEMRIFVKAWNAYYCQAPVVEQATAPISQPAVQVETPYRPCVFTPLDMPETTGNVNIICRRE